MEYLRRAIVYAAYWLDIKVLNNSYVYRQQMKENGFVGADNLTDDQVLNFFSKG